MTISTSVNRYTYSGNGVTTAFAYQSRFLANADIVVLLVVDATGVSTTQVLTTNYTMTGAGDANGGTITMLVAPPTGTTLVIYGDPEIKQATDFVENDALPAETLETAYDRLTLIAARLKDQISRAFKLNDADTTTSPILPIPVGSNGLGWNSAGTALINYVLQAGTSLVDLAASTGSSLVGFIQSGTGAVATDIQTKVRSLPALSPEDFGCVGDGVTDDTTNFGEFLDAANYRTCYLPGVYKLTSLLTKPLTQAVFYGVPGKTKITGAFGYQTMKFLALNGAYFHGITFETTYTNAADGSIALLYSQQTDVKNVSFKFCTFTAPNANIDGLGFYPRTTFADTTAAAIDGLWIEDCAFTSIGRIGCTLMNRGGGADKYTNAKRVYFNRNKGIDLGLSGSYGMLLSLDGFGSNFQADRNEVSNVRDTGIENTGWIDGSVSFNEGLAFNGASSSLLSMNGTDAVNGNRPLSNLTIMGNKCLVPCTTHTNLFDLSRCFVANNNFTTNNGAQAVMLRRSNNNTFVNEQYVTTKATALYALLFDVTSSNNIFDGSCLFDNSASGTNTATIRCADASTGNIFRNKTAINKGTGGSSFDQTGTASLNYVESFLNTWTPTLTGSTNAGPPTYGAVQAGIYTLVGKLCTFNIDIRVTALGTIAGDVQISLPFTAASTVNGVQQRSAELQVKSNGVTIGGGNTYFVGEITQNTAIINIIQTGSVAGTGVVQCTQLAAASTFNISGSYVIA